MKKIILFTLILMLSGSVSLLMAQGKSPKHTPEQRAKKLTARMQKQCALSDEQAIRVSAVNFESAKKMDALRAKKASGEKGLGKQFQTIEQERMDQLALVLKPEQMDCYKKMKQEAIERRKARTGKMQQGKGSKKAAPTLGKQEETDDDLIDQLDSDNNNQ